MRFPQCLTAGLLAGLIASTAAGPLSTLPGNLKIREYESEPLQTIVTWDEHSLFVHGERVLFYSGSFHPYRLPVPGLYLDVFQKIRAMGYTGVTFYINWALLEGTPGVFRDISVFDLQPFIDAASQAGVYLLARPGPYINAESSGGGFPGWLQNEVEGYYRTSSPTYINATQLYAKSVGSIIAANEITKGGPIILMQPENEYYDCTSAIDPCPDPAYMAIVEAQFRDAGVTVPYIDNDDDNGNFAPGKPAAVDIYGIDSYPLGFDCGTPYVWPANGLPTYFWETHEKYSPTTPFSIVEFQGGSFDPWGGWGWQKCLELVSYEFERVFYKNNFASAITIFNIYMTYGGSNWGNLGYAGGYSSYDYAAVIAENRMVDREKYSEAKLLANFLEAAEAYLTVVPGNLTAGVYTNTAALSTTPLIGNGTNFYVVRQTNYTSEANVPYKMTLPTSQGNVTIPQLRGELILAGRDSKIPATDYKAGSCNLLYTTAEVFTWKIYGDQTILVVYDGPQGYSELAVSDGGKATVVEGSGVEMATKDGATVLNWETSASRRIVTLANGLVIYILNRNTAYNYWVLKLADSNGLYAPNAAGSTVIVQAGYLMRNATVSGSTLSLVGDFNATTNIEVIGGAPSNLKVLQVNGNLMKFTQNKYGVVSTTVDFDPNIHVPSLSSLEWKYIDSLPEIKADYDDSLWPVADAKTIENRVVDVSTPTVLFAGRYGFYAGALVYRGHFTANGNETTFTVGTAGGTGYGSSVWLNGSFVGSFVGYDAAQTQNATYTLPNLTKGKNYVFTLVIDTTGLDENYVVGDNSLDDPRGIIAYSLAGHAATDLSWKLTGNLGGTNYKDLTRGPLNEGGLWAERQGYHLPGAPIEDWASSGGPTEGINEAGVAFYAAYLDLDLPKGWDVPLSITFDNTSNVNAAGDSAPAWRVQIYVNGYQFGKYVNNIGPQVSFPVHEGTLNYQGRNYLAFTFWSLEAAGAKVPAWDLVVNGTILSGYGDIPLAPMSDWTLRVGAY